MASRVLVILSVVVTGLALVLFVTADVAGADGGSSPIDISPSGGNVGTTVCVSAEGLPPETQVVLSFGTRDNVVDSAYTDAVGDMGDMCFVVGDCPAGVYWVWMSWLDENDVQQEKKTHFAVHPALELSDDDGHVGTRLLVDATGFGASQAIEVCFDGGEVAESETDVNGAFARAAFDIPQAVHGEHNVTVTDTDGNKCTAIFVVEPRVTLEPVSAPPGSNVTAAGTGFSGDAEVDLYFDGERIGEAETDSDGSFDAAVFHIPPSEHGAHVVEAEDGEGLSATADFSTMADIVLHPVVGAVGSELSVTGSGFRGETSITIVFDADTLGTTRTDGNGSFSIQVRVPARPNGTYYDIKATDGANRAYGEFTIETRADISSVSGHVGQAITVVGSSFEPHGSVVVTFDDTDIARGQASGEGAFSVSFDVPEVAGGDHLVAVTDGKHTKTFTFAVESEPPPAPTPSSPVGGVEVSSPTELQWTPVDDPSGVSYCLELAADAGFTEPLAQLEGLPRPRYLVGEKEELAGAAGPAVYYWRVRAVDRAGNLGDWSPPATFNIGFSFDLPSWAIYSLVLLAVILVGAVCLWMLRNIFHVLRRDGADDAYRQPEEMGDYNF